jgi:aspartyl-tRNA(Asn)/glutamyl-tRNA(Gln) amidotransferase subunit B
VADAGELEGIVEAAIADNPQAAEDFRSGKGAAIGRLIGACMKASGGKADPKVVRELIVKKLSG